MPMMPQVPMVGNGVPYVVPIQPVFAPLPPDYRSLYKKLYGQGAFLVDNPVEASSPYDFSQPILKFGKLPIKQVLRDNESQQKDRKNLPRNQKSNEIQEKQTFQTPSSEKSTTERESRPFVPPNSQQMRRMLFIGNIPKELDDFWMDKILRLSGKLASWRRVADADNSMTSFGFAEFESNEQFSRALEALNDFVVPPLYEGGPSTRLSLITDVENEGLYREWQTSRYARNKQKEINILQQIRFNLERICQDIGNFDVRSRIERAARQAREKNEKLLQNVKTSEIPINAADLEGINPELLPVIEEEIRSFRDQSAMKKREKQRSKDEYASLYKEYTRKEQEKLRKQNDDLQNLLSKHRISRIPMSTVNAFLRAEDSIPESFSDEQAYYEEKRRKDQLEAEEYYARERRWMNREKARTAALEREAAREEEERVNNTSFGTYLSEKLASFDDDEEARVSRDEYFVDRAAWIRHRAVARAREEDADALDRKEEERELRTRGEGATVETENYVENGKLVTSEMPQHENGPFKIKIQTKKPAVPSERREFGLPERLLLEEEDEEPQGYSPNPQKPKPAMEENDAEKTKRLRSLIEKIPVEAESLWALPIDWSKVTEVCDFFNFYMYLN